MSQKNWPRWRKNFINRGFPESSLLAGTEAAVWDALGRLQLKDFDDGKQAVVRKALEDIDLAWIATNTTPFRIAIGALFDAAEECHRRSKKKKNNNGPNLKTNGRHIASIHVHTQKLPQVKDSIAGPVKENIATEFSRAALWDHLERYGAYVIRNAVPASTLFELPEAERGKETKLSRSMGNGCAGDPPSVYMDFGKRPRWHDELEQNIGQLLTGPGAPEEISEADAILKRKSILLLAGEGAENWAHQDNNNETPPVQAMLMLSEPQKDFSGGEFYVARQTRNTDQKIKIVRYSVSFESSGDLVIFMAGKNSGWWHGMLPVKAGDTVKQDEEHLRKAVGMLQPAN